MAQSQNRRNTWEGPNGRPAEAKATELLHLYIYDYCKKKKFVQAARAFSSEANVPTDQAPPFESSTGFLADWWSVFWDIYFAKSKEAEASKEANVMDEYHSFLRTKREEVLQQQRAFNLQQAQQQAQHQQQQQQQAQQQAQLQAQQQVQRRASEAQRVAQSPQLSALQQQQQQDQQQQQQQTPHLQQQQSVASQQAQQQQQQLSRDVRPSPASSTASLPNNNGMPPPPNNNNTIVNTPQSMPANLPQQHIPGRHTASPSFSPQQLQRGVEVMAGGGGPHPQQQQPPPQPQPQPSTMGPEGMMTSPMVGQQMPMQQQQPMMTAAHRAQQQNAIVNAAMNSVGLGGRDQSSLTHDEKIILQNQLRKMTMNQHLSMMRNNPMLANNPQAQARLQMQQQTMLQQQQQQQQQAMLQQQHLQQQQQQHAQQQQQQQGMPPQHVQQQQQPQPQGTPQQQHQMQQQQQGTPQQQQAQLPPHTPQQQHPMGASPQVDPAQRMGPVGPPMNGQPRPHMVGPGGQMGMNPNMQSPNLMNGGIPFNGDVNLMLAQQMMNKGQMPAGLTPQQQQQHQQQMMVAQQQRVIAQQRRMMQQQQQAQQAQQAQQQQQQNQGGGPQQPPAGGPPHSQQPTPQQQPQPLPPGGSQGGANGGPQTPPNMGSPNPAAIPGSGSPEGGDKKKIAVALYQRRQVHHAMQQQQQAQQQAQFVHPPPQKRQRTSNNSDDTPATTPQQMQQSPQLQHKMSPHVMNAQQQQQPNPNESPVMAMQQRLAAQQRSQFEQQQQQQMNSPQLTRNSISGTPQQQQQQLHQQQQQRMSWNPDMDPPMNDMQSPANNMNNPGGMAAAANAAAAAAAAANAAAQNSNNTNAMNNSNVLSFDLERFMMGDSGDFGEMFAAGDENPDQNLLMGGDGADLDPFGGGFLASMGGGLDLDSGMGSGNNSGSNGGAPSSHAINMNANTALQPYADLSGHTNKVSTAAFSMDGQWLASAGHDRKVMIWSVQDKKTLYTLDGHTGNITCARWSADNRNLVATTSYDKTLRIWDVGSALAASGAKEDKEDDSKIDHATTNPKQLAKWDCRAQVTAVDFAPDRPDTICSLDAEGELKVWNLKTSNCEKSLKMTQSKSGFAPNPMRFHPRTASVLACAVGNQINIIDITSSGKSSSGNSNSSSNNIINADNMGVRTVATDHGKNICSFDWSPDGLFLVASSEDKICVYETSHWKCVMNHIPQSKISGCAFVNGGNEKLRLLYGGYQDIFLWQCGIPGAQPKKVGSQSGMVVSIACCSVASGQTLVASASHHQKEKNLMLWTI